MALSLIRTLECSSLKDTFEKILKSIITLRRAKKKSSKMEFDDVTELISMLKDTKRAWNTSILNYEYMTEEELIDYYSYQIKAHELRFEYLLKKAKEKGVRANFYDGL
jgi:hypothetical protein